MEYRDKTLVCSVCGEAFSWTAAEQLFFADHALRHEPKRCRDCRHKPAVSPAGPGRGRSRVESEARCAACGRETTVPFRPTQGRPVYCRDCFARSRVAAKAGNA